MDHGGKTLYFSGNQQRRAQAQVDLVSSSIGIRLDRYVDNVVYTDSPFPIFAVLDDGRRVIGLNDEVLSSSKFMQFKSAAHEINHARHSQRLGHQNYTDNYYTEIEGIVRTEGLVESRALKQTQKYFGNSLPQEVTQDALDFVEGWKAFLE